MVGQVPVELRHERKFLTTRLSAQQVVLFLKLNSFGFRETFAARFVNSIYFDSYDLRNAKDNIDGLAERTKIRIRWYGDLKARIRRPVLEFKHKWGLAGYKARFPIAEFEFGQRVIRDLLDDALKNSELPRAVAETLHAVHPTLICRYRRRYFDALGCAVRATVDEKLTYQSPGGLSTVSSYCSTDNRGVILELKYDPDLEDLVQGVTNQFPFRLSRSSKYLMGLQRLRGAY